jgi:excisionase family DNA binding protein
MTLRLDPEQLVELARMVAIEIRSITPASGASAYTVAEAARVLGVTTETVRRRVKAGILPTIPGLGTTRIPAAHLDRLLSL